MNAEVLADTPAGFTGFERTADAVATRMAGIDSLAAVDGYATTTDDQLRECTVPSLALCACHHGTQCMVNGT